jgi:hypothetical protein
MTSIAHRRWGVGPDAATAPAIRGGRRRRHDRLTANASAGYKISKLRLWVQWLSFNWENDTQLCSLFAAKLRFNKRGY